MTSTMIEFMNSLWNHLCDSFTYQHSRYDTSVGALDGVSAINEVFGTVELLERILLWLPSESLYRLQRVNRQYRDVLAGSAKLQQAMFLSPLREPRAMWERSHPVRILGVSANKLEYYRMVRVNPVFRKLPQRHTRDCMGMRFFKLPRITLQFPFEMANTSDSRLRQFLTSPPCQSVYGVVYPRPGLWWKPREHIHIELSIPGGVKVEDLIQAVRNSKLPDMMKTLLGCDAAQSKTMGRYVKCGVARIWRRTVTLTDCDFVLEGVVIC